MLVLVVGGRPAAQAQDLSGRGIAQLSEEAEAVARKVRAAVVQVKAQRVTRLQNRVGETASLRKKPSTGSGFFVDERGYLVTNAHVVSGASEVWVQQAAPPAPPPGEKSILRRRGSLLEATIVGVDTETDVAVLKVKRSGYPTIPFGNSDALDRGQVVFAFGAPLGLGNSMSMGVVSATARQFQSEDPMIYIQTDAPINPGSSGGPLVNAKGEVVGMNTLTASKEKSSGVGFAGPSNIVKAVYEQIREHGHARRGGIGVYAQTISPELAQEIGADRSHRVILSDVYAGEPAEQVGLKPGDIVTHLDGERMHNGRELDINLYPKAGTVVTLRVVRGDSAFKQDVRVVRQRRGSARYAQMEDPADHLVEPLSILAVSLTEETAPRRAAALRLQSGIVVVSSSRVPAPWGDQLRSGDVLYSVNGKRVATLDDLRSVLETNRGERVVAHVLRGSQMQYLVLPVNE